MGRWGADRAVLGAWAVLFACGHQLGCGGTTDMEGFVDPGTPLNPGATHVMTGGNGGDPASGGSAGANAFVIDNGNAGAGGSTAGSSAGGQPSAGAENGGDGGTSSGGSASGSCTPVPPGPERDADNDGIIDVFDPDDDNDGMTDLEECFSGATRFVNPSFELPVLGNDTPSYSQTDAGNVPGWDNDSAVVEIWESGFFNISSVDGDQFIELSSTQVDTLWQDIETIPGTTLRWGFHHRNRMGANDTLELSIGPVADVSSQGQFTTGSAWELYEGEYVVPDGQTRTRFEFEHVIPGSEAQGNLLDLIDAEPICTVDTDGDGCVDTEDAD